ncbi:MAG: hypothetical protein ACYDEJ_09570 [Desulfitobacteriaceae bacterium]
MKFSMLEAVKERVQAYKTMCTENDQKRAAAKQEISAVKEKVQELINRQIEGGEDLIDEVAKAQARVTVAEAKYQRLVNKIGAENPEMGNGNGVSFHSVYSEMRLYSQTGLRDDMKVELEELQTAKDNYLAAAEKALVKFYELRRELRQSVLEAEVLFNQTPKGAVPDTMYEARLRPFGLWWELYDAYNEMSPIKKRAMEAVEGPVWLPAGISFQDKREIPQPQPTTGPKAWIDEKGVVWERQTSIIG